MLAAAVVLNGAALAQENDGTVAASRVAGDHKPVSAMTPEERQAFWASLPDDEKQRILERRQGRAAAAEAEASKEKDKVKTDVPVDVSATGDGLAPDTGMTDAAGRPPYAAKSITDRPGIITPRQAELNTMLQNQGTSSNSHQVNR